MKKIFMMVAGLYLSFQAVAQDTLTVVRVNEQRTFPEEVPAGNYSGITYLGDSLYAVVSDKAKCDGFFVFKIALDSVSGDVQWVKNMGFKGDTDEKGDVEGIAYVPSSKLVYISRETDNTIKEYTLDGRMTGRQLPIPQVYARAGHNYGLESLTYNVHTKTFWTCNEGTLKGDGEQATAMNGVQNRLRLQAFNQDLQPTSQYAYLMDPPEANKKAYLYGMGVGEVTALDDGSLLVLEREFYTPLSKLGAFVSNKLYRVQPDKGQPLAQVDSLGSDSRYLEKQLVTKWKTHLSLFHHEIANYEGMCVGPSLADGSQVLVLLSDSQDQAEGVMKDWFKTIVIKLPGK